jgi:Leucine rich repeat
MCSVLTMFSTKKSSKLCTRTTNFCVCLLKSPFTAPWTPYRRERLLSTENNLIAALPAWCYFSGITCGSILGTSSYGRVTDISLVNLGLIGTIPESLSNLRNLIHFDMSDNSIYGTIPSSLGLWSSQITCIRISKNSLVGSIPSTFGRLSSLEVLSLESNLLNGKIPTSLGYLSSLKNLSMDMNCLSGTIPDSIASMTSLKELSAAVNYLTGTIPASMGHITSLVKLYLDSNSLTGNIPSGVSNLKQLTDLHLQSNQLSGTIPSTISGMSSITSLFVSSNTLTGTIPSVIGTMTSLRELSLEFNALSGTIPAQISALVHLAFLHIQHNSLTMGSDRTLCKTIFSLTTLNGFLSLCNNYIEYASHGIKSLPDERFIMDSTRNIIHTGKSTITRK